MTYVREVDNNNSSSVSSGNAAAAPVPFPPIPPVPGGIPSDDPTTWSNWPPVDDNGNYEAQSFSDDGYMQVLMNQLTAISAHPGSSANFVMFMKTVSYLSQLRNRDGSSLLTADKVKFLTENANSGNLLKDAIDQLSQYGFLYGYNSAGAGTWQALGGFAQQLQVFLQGLQASGSGNDFITDMLTETTQIAGDTPSAGGAWTETAFETEYLNGSSNMAAHINTKATATDAYGNPVAVGDIIFTFEESYIDSSGHHQYGKVIYDWTTAIAAEKTGKAANPPSVPEWATNTMNKITASIENASGTAGGPNPDIDTLDAALNQMQVVDSLNTFFAILKTTGDIGLAILAFIFEWEGYKMNTSLAGPADVMDKEKRFSQWAKQIEDNLKELSTSFTGAQAMEIVGNTISLFETINESGQFADSLASAVSSAENTFQTTMIAYPPSTTVPPAPITPTTPTRSLWDLFIAACLPTDDPSYVSPDNLAKALVQAMVVTPPTSAGGSTDPGSLALQGLLGAFDGFITAVTSASSSQTAISSAGQALIQALDKVMDLVTSQQGGMNTAVINKTLQLPS